LSLQMGAAHTMWGVWVRRGIGWLLIFGVCALLIAVIWKPLLPFAAALLFAGAVQKPYRWLLSLTRQRRGQSPSAEKYVPIPVGWQYAAAIGLILCCLMVGGALLFAVSYLLLSELGHIFSWLGENGAVISGSIGTMMESILRLLDRLPLPQGITGEDLHSAAASSVLGVLPDMIGGLLGTVSAKVSAAVTGIVSALPKILLFIAVFLIAAVYMTVSYDAIRHFLHNRLPHRWQASLAHFKSAFGGTVCSVLRAYLLLFAVTFVLMSVGLLLLGVEHTLSVALIGMMIDILPVFGVGTLLIPWAIVSFLGGNAGRGVGLVVLYLVICFVRQALEPRLIGKTVGVHPLAVLFALYAGGMLFGIVGMIVSPFLLTVLWRGYRMIERSDRAQ